VIFPSKLYRGDERSLNWKKREEEYEKKFDELFGEDNWKRWIELADELDLDPSDSNKWKEFEELANKYNEVFKSLEEESPEIYYGPRTLWGKVDYTPNPEEHPYWKDFPLDYFPHYILIDFHTHPTRTPKDLAEELYINTFYLSPGDIEAYYKNYKIDRIKKSIFWGLSPRLIDPNDLEKYFKLKEIKPLMILGKRIKSLPSSAEFYQKFFGTQEPYILAVFQPGELRKPRGKLDELLMALNIKIKNFSMLFKRKQFYVIDENGLKNINNRKVSFSFSAGKIYNYRDFLEQYWKKRKEFWKENEEKS
jgi:hypothetical protein